MRRVELDNLMELYRSGMTQEQIAEHFGVTQPTVCRKLQAITRTKAWIVKAGFRESRKVQALMAERDKWKLRAEEQDREIEKLKNKLRRIEELVKRYSGC